MGLINYAFDAITLSVISGIALPVVAMSVTAGIVRLVWFLFERRDR